MATIQERMVALLEENEADLQAERERNQWVDKNVKNKDGEGDGLAAPSTDYETLLGEHMALRAILQAHMPEGLDYEKELDRVGTNRKGEYIYVAPIDTTQNVPEASSEPVIEQPVMVERKAAPRPPARQPAGRAASNGKVDFSRMSVEELAAYGNKIMAVEDAANRSSV